MLRESQTSVGVELPRYELDKNRHSLRLLSQLLVTMVFPLVVTATKVISLG